jgi:hypothetical protein
MQAAAAAPITQGPAPARPRLICSSELAGPALLALLRRPGVLDALAAGRFGVAMALLDLGDERAEAVRLLAARGIYCVAWLVLPPAEGYWFNLQNYPQALERYSAFHGWAQAERLRFDAVGIDIEPPVSVGGGTWGARKLLSQLWQARKNALYPGALAAYRDLIAEMHEAGYEVHAYQLPLLADDRRAGTTLIQRALEIVEVPADVEVLMCYSSLPLDRFGNDLGGALVASYGPAADGVALGITGGGAALETPGVTVPPLSWPALERDLLLAANFADTIYIFSLEGCVERGLLRRIIGIDWNGRAQPVLSRRALVALMRAALLATLLALRFSRALVAWGGWIVAALLVAREVQRRLRRE